MFLLLGTVESRKSRTPATASKSGSALHKTARKKSENLQRTSSGVEMTSAAHAFSMVRNYIVICDIFSVGWYCRHYIIFSKIMQHNACTAFRILFPGNSSLTLMVWPVCL